MMRFLQSQLFERILFTLVVVGILLGVYSLYQVLTINSALSQNIAQQIHDSGEELAIQTTAEGQGIVAADMERRAMLRTRAQHYVAGGISLVLIGLGWVGYDFRNSRRKQTAHVQVAAEA
jgi:ABC-type lipoprotein release transport system permease subunit